MVHSFHVPGGKGGTGGDGVDIGETVIADLEEDLSTIDRSLSGNTLKIRATLDSAHLGFTPDVDFSMSFGGGHLKKLHFAASGTMDAAIAAELDVQVTGTLSDLGLDELKSHTPKVKKQLWASEVWNLPTEWIGVIPVEESVQMYVNAQCSVSFSGFAGGELHVTTGASGSATITGGIDYASGAWTPSDGAHRLRAGQPVGAGLFDQHRKVRPLRLPGSAPRRQRALTSSAENKSTDGQCRASWIGRSAPLEGRIPQPGSGPSLVSR